MPGRTKASWWNRNKLIAALIVTIGLIAASGAFGIVWWRSQPTCPAESIQCKIGQVPSSGGSVSLPGTATVSVPVGAFPDGQALTLWTYRDPADADIFRATADPFVPGSQLPYDIHIRSHDLQPTAETTLKIVVPDTYRNTLPPGTKLGVLVRDHWQDDQEADDVFTLISDPIDAITPTISLSLPVWAFGRVTNGFEAVVTLAPFPPYFPTTPEGSAPPLVGMRRSESLLATTGASTSGCTGLYREPDGTMGSGWGQRNDPFGHNSKENHPGIDFKVPNGSVVRAATDGVAEIRDEPNGFGHYVVIKGTGDAQGRTTYYGHMQEAGRVSGPVKMGDPIGKADTSGRSTGPHVHFGSKDPSGKWENPTNCFKTPESPPHSPPPGPRCIAACGLSQGDPHLVTFDGGTYDFQGAGEFIAAKSTTDDFEIQVRQIPWYSSRDVAGNSAVAMRITGHRVGIYLSTSGSGTTSQVLLDGINAPPSEQAHQLSGGGKIQYYLSGDNHPELIATWPDGSVVRVDGIGSYLSYFVSVSASRSDHLAGLLGNADGDAANDFRTRSGNLITYPPSFSELYGTFGNSWRVTQTGSLFDYGTGQSTSTFTDLTFPHAAISARDLPEAKRADAEAICRARGVVIGYFLQSCILDVGLTGDTSFADSAWTAQAYSPEGAFPIAVGDKVGPGGACGGGRDQHSRSAPELHVLGGGWADRVPEIRHC